MNPRSVRLLARSKINLGLRVRGRRADGYHLLDMVNVTTSLSDEVTVRRGEGDTISLSVTSELPGVEEFLNRNPQSNIVWRAVELFLSTIGSSAAIEILLRKNIPLGGGLGGGSADGAAVLTALAILFKEKLPRIAVSSWLPTVALNLGADVPYLLRGGLARVRGVGEEVSPLKGADIDTRQVLLIFPPRGCETPQVYSQLRELVPLWPQEITPLLPPGCEEISWSNISAIVQNDLVPAAERVYPEVAQIRRALSAIPHTVAGMSGSGSTLFLLPKDSLQLDPTALSASQELCREHQCQQAVYTLDSASVDYPELIGR